MEKIKVAVRVRPLNRKEQELKEQSVVTVENNQIVVCNNCIKERNANKCTKAFTFDHCFDSSTPQSPLFASNFQFFSLKKSINQQEIQFFHKAQETLFKCLGLDLVNNAFNGYNACIFAYGQTSSGKSYSMTGSPNNKGLIPRICEEIFKRIDEYMREEIQFKVEASYMEIYNEKVLDLLDPKGLKQNLKVREHQLLGPYVDDLSHLAVSSYRDIEILLNEGNKSRTVAATNMNAESSRSHAVFCVKLSQIITDSTSGISGEKVSKLSLVDLAGSEKASKTGAEGERLKEGSNINKSLHTLGLVISALAETTKSTSKEKHIPYRDSVLTWLLKDSLGGNSKTVMIATISPSADNYEETLSTLRYADRAKRIVNHAIVNEDPNAKIIRELRDEIEELKRELDRARKDSSLSEKLHESEKLYNDLSKPWDEKLVESELRHKEFESELQKLGISVESHGIKVEKDKYYLVNMNDDPFMNELLVYYLKDVSLVGAHDSSDIKLSGLGVSDRHCLFEIKQNQVFLTPLNDNMNTFVNKELITSEIQLNHGDRILIGLNHFFRLNCPKNSYSPNKSQTSDFNMKDYCPSLLHNDLNELAEKQDFYVTLDEQLVRTDSLIREANSLVNELNINFKFFITLQIPMNILMTRNLKKNTCFFEPAILVKKYTTLNAHNSLLMQHDIWSLDKFKHKLIEMREIYNDLKIKREDNQEMNELDDSQQNHTLIGIANVYLEAFFYDCVFNYNVPFISQQGEIIGCLKIQLKHENLPVDANQENGHDVLLSSTIESSSLSTSETSVSDKQQPSARKIKCIINIIEAFDLKTPLKHNSYLEFKFWNEPETLVAPLMINDDADNKLESCLQKQQIKFNHTKEYVVNLNAKFADYCADNSLAIKLWAHPNKQHQGEEYDDDNDDDDNSSVQSMEDKKMFNLMNEWNQVRKSLDLWIEILELDKNGQWTCVDIKQGTCVLTGGVYQLKQGQSRRIRVRLKQKLDDDSLNYSSIPFFIDSFNYIEIGGVIQNSEGHSLDSYQEEDLTRIRDKWSNLLNKRRDYLTEQIKAFNEKEDKSEIDIEREKNLYEEMILLTEELNFVYNPPHDSCLPGSTLSWQPEKGMEETIPSIFMDLDSNLFGDSSPEDSLSNSDRSDAIMSDVAGANCLLIDERKNDYHQLKLLSNKKYFDSSSKILESMAQWDSTIHESNLLNAVTYVEQNFVYLTLKVNIKLAQPHSVNILLRKRISVQIISNEVKKQAQFQQIKSGISRFKSLLSATGMSMKTNHLPTKETNEAYLKSTGVKYFIYTNIPTRIEEFESKESLASIAARSNGKSSFIDSYSRMVSNVERLLKFDKIKQEFVLKRAIEIEYSKKQSNETLDSPTSPHTHLSLANPHRSSSISDFNGVGKFSNLVNSKFGGSIQNISQYFKLKTSEVKKSGDTKIEYNRLNDVITDGIKALDFGSSFMEEIKTDFESTSKNLIDESPIKVEDTVDSQMIEVKEEEKELQNESKFEEVMHEYKSRPIVESTQKSLFEIVNDEKIQIQDKLDENTPLKSQKHEELEYDSTSCGSKTQQLTNCVEISSPKVEIKKSKEELLLAEWIKLGTHVIVTTSTVPNKPGIIRFIGFTHFAKGTWIGVELEREFGINDGSVGEHRYFECKEKKGVFVKAEKLTLDKFYYEQK